jgi:5,10-methylenetetrahydrofolate reductase
MQQRKFAEKIVERSSFLIVAELVGGPGYNFAPVEKFLADYKKAGSSAISDEFDFAGITLPQSPGGVANIEPASIIAQIQPSNLGGNLEFIPHVSCKDTNADAITSSLRRLKIYVLRLKAARL